MTKAGSTWLWVLTAAALAAVPLVGCTREERAQKQEEAEEAAEEAAEEGKEVARKAGDELEKAGDKASEAMKKLGDKVDAAKQTLDVKAALMAEKGLDASAIDVDTDAKANTVTLRGTVPTAAQKATAGRIAKSKAEGYTVKNELRVAARAKAS